MTPPDPFVDHVLELLEPLGALRARRMFGGHGVYCDGLMFALIADGVLYFKADAASRGELERAGSQPFAYDKGEQRVTMSYWRAPESALENTEQASPWARAACDAARRARRSGPRLRPGR